MTQSSPRPADHRDSAAAAAARTIDQRILSLRAEMGRDLLILGHHYQSDAVLKHADMVGDSLKLSRQASMVRAAKYLVFCGVDFMAETAEVISGPRQQVFVPDGRAGCPMAAMAQPEQVAECWEELARLWGMDLRPLTYVNSSAWIKAFCGRRGGATCTSSNAEAVMGWALSGGSRVLFLPDRHLGLNTARALGLKPEEISVWDRGQGELRGPASQTKVVLWDGHCPVHDAFSLEDVQRARIRHPGLRVVVHPECPPAVLDAADAYGSTERIIDFVAQAPAGATVAVGTEMNLVARLARRHPEKKVVSLAPAVPPCADMAKIDPAKLLQTLEGLADGGTCRRVSVEQDTAAWAGVAIERMLALS